MKNLIILVIFLSIIYTVGHCFVKAFEFITGEEDNEIQIQQGEQWSQTREPQRRSEQNLLVTYGQEPEPQIVYSSTCPYCDGKGTVTEYIEPPPNFSGDLDHYENFPRREMKQTCSNCNGKGEIYFLNGEQIYYIPYGAKVEHIR